MPGEIDYVWLTIVVLGVVLLAVLLHENKARKAVNLAIAEGNFVRAIDLATELRRSTSLGGRIWRWFYAGDLRKVIGAAHYALGQNELAIACLEDAARVARRRGTKASAHEFLAKSYANMGNREACERHLDALRLLDDRTGRISVSFASTAVECYRLLGDPVKALEVFTDHLGTLNHTRHYALWPRGIAALTSLGRWEEVLTLNGGLWSEQAATGRTQAPPSTPNMDAPGQQQVMKMAQQAVDAGLVFACMETAAAAQQWDVFAALLEHPCLAQMEDALLEIRVIAEGFRARWAGHRGEHEGVVAAVRQMAEYCDTSPRNRRLVRVASELEADAWSLLGEHERVLNALAKVPADWVVSPLERSYRAHVAAESLAALGRHGEADGHRRQAELLAPHAHWNGPQPEDVAARVDACVDAIHAGRLGDGDGTSAACASPPTLVRPVAPAVSGLTWVCCVLAFLAVVPVLGALPAIPLLALSCVLAVRRRRRAHDRPVALATLMLSIVSLGIAGLAIAAHVDALSPPDLADFVYVGDDGNAVPVPEESEGWQAENLSTLDADGGGADEPDQPEEALTSMPADGGGADEMAGDDTAMVRVGESASTSSAAVRLTGLQIVAAVVILVLSVMLHEIGHAVAAFWVGDPTARDAGRFSLNPLRHLSWFGSVVVPAVLAMLPGGTVIGWAKPVPITPVRFRHARRGQLAVSLAGVGANLLVMLLTAQVMVVVLIALAWQHPQARWTSLSPFLGQTSLWRVPDADAWITAIELCKGVVWINAILACFNLLPVGPLDGFKLVRSLTPRPLVGLLDKLAGFSTIIFFCLIIFNWLVWLLVPGVVLAGAVLGWAAAAAGWPIFFF